MVKPLRSSSITSGNGAPTSIPVDRYYEGLRALGLEYGGSFRGIEMLQRGNGEVLTRVRLPAASLH